MSEFLEYLEQCEPVEEDFYFTELNHKESEHPSQWDL